jgi:hypothetical protein
MVGTSRNVKWLCDILPLSSRWKALETIRVRDVPESWLMKKRGGHRAIRMIKATSLCYNDEVFGNIAVVSMLLVY